MFMFIILSTILSGVIAAPNATQPKVFDNYFTLQQRYTLTEDKPISAALIADCYAHLQSSGTKIGYWNSAKKQCYPQTVDTLETKDLLIVGTAVAPIDYALDWWGTLTGSRSAAELDASPEAMAKFAANCDVLVRPHDSKDYNCMKFEKDPNTVLFLRNK